LLKGGKSWHGANLLQELGVDPMNTHALAIITKQLQNLQDLKLAKKAHVAGSG